MHCPHCHSHLTTALQRRTRLGYQIFQCRHCRRTFNERTGTPFNFLEVPTDIVFQVLFCRFRYKLSYRDLAEFFRLRGFSFSHEAVREWEQRFTPLFAQQLRSKRRGTCRRVWHVDETYVKVKGKWCYLYRSIDEDGNLVDVMLSEHRDLAAAKAFFKQASELGEPPQEVVTDGHAAYPRAVAEVLGEKVQHLRNAVARLSAGIKFQHGARRRVKAVNNPVEQSHRGIKQRYYPTMGFGEFEAAKRFCQAVEEVNQYLRVRLQMGEFVSLAGARKDFEQKIKELESLFQAI